MNIAPTMPSSDEAATALARDPGFLPCALTLELFSICRSFIGAGVRAIPALSGGTT